MSSGLKSKAEIRNKHSGQQDALDALIRKEREKEKQYLTKSMSWIVEEKLTEDFKKQRASV